MSEKDELFYKIGDRVILHGLQNAAHVNGRHGVISGNKSVANDRFPVDLDLWDSDAPGSLGVKAVNLQREPPLLEEAIAERATVEDGILTEKFGRPLSFLLDTMRVLSARFFFGHDEVNDMNDINRIRAMGGPGLLQLNQFIAAAWSHWLDPGSFHTPENRGVYEMLREWAHSQLEGREESTLAAIPNSEKTLFQFLIDAVEHPAAVKGWNVRIHGDFWVVSMDDSGTYLVPAENTKRVYQVLGILNALYPMLVQMYPRPVLMKLTMIPFYGRLVYDGVVSPGGSGAPTRSPPMASVQKAEELHLAVEAAKEEHRVVDRLRQLEVSGGSRTGLHERKNPTIIKKSQQEQGPPTAQEKTMVEAFKKIAAYPADNWRDGNWVMRRHGYTEHENPNHVIAIMTANGGVLDVFSVDKLEPTAIEILKKTMEATRRTKKRPSVLNIDDDVCYRRVEFLLKDVAGTKVKYYMPPTKEETAAAMLNPNPFGM